MNIFERSLLLFTVVLLAGCGTTRDVAVGSYKVTRGAAVGSYKVARAVAVGSYRVASAPVHYATRKSDEPRMVGTTEATESDVTEPEQAGPPSEAASASQRRPKPETESSQTSHVARRETTQVNPKPSTSARVSSAQTEFPTAKAVPGKSGYVFSPFDASGRYVDVSGYAPGTKVKDPWTDKIFIVP
jgi:hypothetical protein